MTGGHRSGVAQESRLTVGFDKRPSSFQQGLGGGPLEAGLGAQQPLLDEAKGLPEGACVESARFPQEGRPSPGRPLEADRNQPGFALEEAA